MEKRKIIESKLKDKNETLTFLNNIATLLAVGLGVYLFLHALCEND